VFEFLKQRTRQEGLVALALHGEGVCVARVDWPAGQRPRLVASEYRPLGEGEAATRELQRVATEYKLKQARCTTLLDSSDYSLLLTEAPDVQPEELKTALRWRIKDLIDFHINDATLDAFDLPGQEGTSRVREMYAVAARNDAIRRCVDRLTGAGVNLDIIDIPEMAQRNLAALLADDAQGVAFVSFDNRGGLLTVTRQGELYLSRGIDVGLDLLFQPGGPTDYFDRVALEVQRSLDYYESHFRQAPVRSLVLAPVVARATEFVDYLRANLSVAVSVMNLAELMELESGVPPELEGPCLFTLGAALRREEKAL
jgi:MSHA biogenesis protein MshI